jgi:DNA-binding NarL/FixJ family response regulator
MRLAVIDDHDLLLGAVSVAIRAMEGEFVPHEFETLEAYDEAIAAGSRFDLVLLDLGLPGYTDLTALRYFRQWHDDTPVVVISATHDRETILRSLDLGAMGFIPKTAKRPVFQAAIALVAKGGIYIPKEALVPEPQDEVVPSESLPGSTSPRPARSPSQCP